MESARLANMESLQPPETPIMARRYSEETAREVLAVGDYLNEPILATRVARDGGNVRDLFARLANRQELPSTETLLGLTPRDVDGFSITRLVQAMAQGKTHEARHESDMSKLLTAKTGHVGNGELIPFSVLARDFNVGTPTQAGNLVGAGRTGELVGDPIRKTFDFAALGATFLTGLNVDTTLPVFASTSTAAHLTEIGTASAITESTRAVTLTPRRLAVSFVMSRQAAIQSTPELDLAITRQMRAAINQEMNRAILAGDGSGQNPTGILNDSAVNVIAIGTDGGTLTYQALVDMEAGPNVASIPAGNGAWIVNAGTHKFLRTKVKATGLPYVLEGGNILERPVMVNNNLPANLTKGSGSNLQGLVYSNSWENLLIGIFGAGFDVTVDRVTLADQGKLRVVVSLFYSHGLIQPLAFSACKDAALA